MLEFARGMEDLALPGSELGDPKVSIADVNRGPDRIANKIDPEGELKESRVCIKSNGDFDDAIEELTNIKNIGGDVSKWHHDKASYNQNKTPKPKSSKEKELNKWYDQQAATSEFDEGQMTLIDHLTELRNRLGIALAAFLVIFLVSVAPWLGTTSNSIAYHVFVLYRRRYWQKFSKKRRWQNDFYCLA